MGRRFGVRKIPYNLQKSWCGSISMFIVGFLVSIGYVASYSILFPFSSMGKYSFDLEVAKYAGLAG